MKSIYFCNAGNLTSLAPTRTSFQMNSLKQPRNVFLKSSPCYLKGENHQIESLSSVADYLRKDIKKLTTKMEDKSTNWNRLSSNTTRAEKVFREKTAEMVKLLHSTRDNQVQFNHSSILYLIERGIETFCCCHFMIIISLK